MNPNNLNQPLAPSISQVPELSANGLNNPLIHALWHHNVIPVDVPAIQPNFYVEDPKDLDDLITVAGTPNYLPVVRFNNGVDRETWLRHAAESYLESSQQLIADIYMHWLKLRQDKPLTPITLMWNNEVPMPTEATILWWLLHCESWPLPTSDIAKLLRMAPAIGDRLDFFFPPQPFVFPQCIHLNNITNQPRTLVAAHHSSPVGYESSLGPAFVNSLSRTDREHFSRTSSDVTPVFRPGYGDSILCHAMLGRPYEEIATTRSRFSEDKFTANPVNAVDSGYAFDQVAGSIHHLDVLHKLRQRIMHKAGTVPGLPTHRNSLYEGAGMHLLCYQKANLILHAKEPTPWTHNNSRIVINEMSSAPAIPQVAPKFWFGFTGDHRDWNNPDTNQARMNWVRAYLAMRPLALKQLFLPETIDWERIKMERARQRYSILHKASRIVDPTETNIKTVIAGNVAGISTAFNTLKKG